jgi:hypothetical protein
VPLFPPSPLPVPTRLAPWLACLVLAGTGCTRQVYTQVYLEQMGSEIRQLEDRIYEYDAEYRMLERELDQLERENARLQAKLELYQERGGAERRPSAPSTTPSPSGAASRGQLPAPSSAPSGSPPAVPQSPRGSAEPPSLLPPLEGFDLESDVLEPPGIEEPPLAQSPPAVPPRGRPSALGPVGSGAVSPASASLGRGGDVRTAAAERTAAPAAVAPASPAMAASTAATSSPSPGSPAGGQLPKLSEIAFHPSLCRVASGDLGRGQQGLYLVLQPRDERGQFVPLAGQLSVVVSDPSSDAEDDRLGRWDFSPPDVAEMMQATGHGRGVHLPLQWPSGIDGENPPAENMGGTVVVHIRYQLSNGLRLVNQRTFQLSAVSDAPARWTGISAPQR